MKPTKNDKPKGEFFIRSCDYGVEDDKRTIKGVIPYNSDSVDMYGTTERITPTAFNKTLADKAEDSWKLTGWNTSHAQRRRRLAL